MSKEHPPIDINVLRTFTPLDGIKTENLTALARKAIFTQLPSDKIVFKQGDELKHTVYLVSGMVELILDGETVDVVRAGTPEARNPLVPTVPRRYTCMVASHQAEFLIVDSDLLDVMLTWDQTGSYSVDEISENTPPPKPKVTAQPKPAAATKPAAIAPAPKPVLAASAAKPMAVPAATPAPPATPVAKPAAKPAVSAPAQKPAPASPAKAPVSVAVSAAAPPVAPVARPAPPPPPPPPAPPAPTISVMTEGDWMTALLQNKDFHRVPPTNLQALFMRLKRVDVSMGQTIINQGEDGDFFYVIVKGACQVTRTTPMNQEGVKIAELGVGDTFGEEALVANEKRNANVTMLTDGALMRLGKEDFLQLLHEPMLEYVDQAAADDMVAKGAKWLDVRLPSEFEVMHLRNAINLPLYFMRIKVKSLDANVPYIVYCDTGRRSAAGAYILSERGFQAYVLRGGLQNANKSKK